MKSLIKAILRQVNFSPSLTLEEYAYYGFRTVKHYLGGVLFDLLSNEYRLGKLKFTIPYELTNKTFRGRYFWKTYEEREVKYISKYLKPESTVLELGGCIGVISCLINSLLNDGKKHVVVEANPYLIPYLTINKNRNNSQFIIENKVVTKERKVNFFIHELIVGGSQIRKTNKAIKIPGVTVKQLEQRHKIKFDVLVMDIEGAEKKFIEEFQTEISKFKLLFIEFHPFEQMLTAKEIKNSEKTLRKIGFNRIVKDQIYQIWKKTKKN